MEKYAHALWNVRYFLVVVACVACRYDGSGLPVPGASTPVTEPAFTIVVLPDTQNYILNSDTLERQLLWIAHNAQRLRLAFVLHVGDIVNWNRDEEWRKARKAFGVLDNAKIPYMLTIGNHDMGKNGSASDRTTKFHQYFLTSEFRPRPYFGDTMERGKLENAYYTVAAGGIDWLILCLEFGPRDQTLRWAASVLQRHRGRRAIVVTHDYLYVNNTRHDPSEDFHPRTKAMTALPGNTVNDGDDIWDKLIRKHANIEFVLSGHVTKSGAARLTSIGDHGQRVHQILSNYQDYPNGGDGWLRIMRFDPVRRQVSVWTYSPTRDRFLTGPRHQFGLRALPRTQN